MDNTREIETLENTIVVLNRKLNKLGDMINETEESMKFMQNHWDEGVFDYDFDLLPMVNKLHNLEDEYDDVQDEIVDCKQDLEWLLGEIDE